MVESKAFHALVRMARERGVSTISWTPEKGLQLYADERIDPLVMAPQFSKAAIMAAVNSHLEKTPEWKIAEQNGFSFHVDGVPCNGTAVFHGLRRMVTINIA